MKVGRVVLMAVLALFQVALAGCAALIPERVPLTWRVENLAREDRPATGETRWTYMLVIDNPGRSPAKLIQESVTLGWNGVYLSPAIEQTARPILGRSTLRLPSSSIFRRSDFEAVNQSSPGRPPNAPQRLEGMWIYWQFLGRYERGDAIILNADFFPERSR